jgi:hypothetical protein
MTTPGDEVARWRYPVRDLIKLGVHGVKLEVLVGIIQALRRCRWLVVESFTASSYSGQATSADFWGRLEERLRKLAAAENLCCLMAKTAALRPGIYD